MKNSGMGRPMERDFGFKKQEPKSFATKPVEETTKSGFLSNLSPFRMIAITIIIGLFGYMYIAHVFYTQKLLTEVNSMRISFENARVDHTDTKLTYERMTGPAEVYTRAKSLGLTDGGPADRIITRN